MDTLTCMHTFVRVVETQSFTKAAHDVSISPSLASKQIAWLEGRLGTRLLSRSTRRLNLTETGQAYYTQSLKVLTEAQTATNIVAELQGRPQGTLRVTCPTGLGASVLNQAFAEFSLLYPAIDLETRLTDQIVDFTEERNDFALRLVPHMPDSTLVANELASITLNICAAPAYLQRHGTPQTPADLSQHNCLRYSHTQVGADVWHFPHQTQPQHDQYVAVSGNYRANNPAFMKEAVVQGVGIAILPSYIHKAETEDGRIRVLFGDRQMEKLKLYLVREQRQFIPLRMKLFATFIKSWVHKNIIH